MSEDENKFKNWAVVEVMGHNTYAGFVTEELIAGKPMLRVDIPQVDNIPAFTKYLSPDALYGLTPCSEDTARAKAVTQRAKPFETWRMEDALTDQLRSKGMLIEDQTENNIDEVNFF